MAPATVAAVPELEAFIAKQVQDYRVGPRSITELHEAIKGSEALQSLKPHQLHDAIASAFSHVKGRTAAGAIDAAAGTIDLDKFRGQHVVVLDDILNAAGIVKKAQPKPDRPEVMARLKEQMAEREPSLMKPRAQRFNLKALTVEERFNSAMWGVGMLLGAFGVYSSAKYSVAKDDQGKNHVQWSQVGIALLQACMTAGCAYMGAQSLRGAMVR